MTTSSDSRVLSISGAVIPVLKGLSTSTFTRSNAYANGPSP